MVAWTSVSVRATGSPSSSCSAPTSRDATKRRDGCARELRRLWDVVTPPTGQERVPIWMGYQGPKGARRAGLLGEGLLSIDHRLWEPYRDGLLEAGHEPACRWPHGRRGQRLRDHDPERDWPTSRATWQPSSTRTAGTWSRALTSRSRGPSTRSDCAREAESRHPLDSIVYGTPEEVAAPHQSHRIGCAGRDGVPLGVDCRHA